MPCYDPPFSKEERIKYGMYNEEDLIQMLCFVMRHGSAWFDVPIKLSEEDTVIEARLNTWWKKHQEFDRKRNK